MDNFDTCTNCGVVNTRENRICSECFVSLPWVAQEQIKQTNQVVVDGYKKGHKEAKRLRANAVCEGSEEHCAEQAARGWHPIKTAVPIRSVDCYCVWVTRVEESPPEVDAFVKEIARRVLGI